MFRRHQSREHSTRMIGLSDPRRGSVLAMIVVFMLAVFAFAAMTVDVGLITLTKGQMQNAADSSAHAAMLELYPAIGPGGEISSSTAAANARSEAVAMIGSFRTAELASTPAVGTRDIRFGRRSWDADRGEWREDWGLTPYNIVEVTVRRTHSADAPIPLNFGPLLGRPHHELEVSSVVSVAPVEGFSLNDAASSGNGSGGGSSTLGILPIALDLGTWSSLMDQIYHNQSNGFTDNYGMSGSSVTTFGDGIPELNLYPDANTNMPPGNRGTVDIGSPNNSTADLVRQIRYGLNSYDLSFFPNNEIRFNDEGAVYFQGDTGISAGIESALQSIIGQTRIIPIFIEVEGPGNNAVYTVVKFVSIRVMAVTLRGGPSRRHLTIQPAPCYTQHGIRGEGEIYVDSILSTPHVIR